jgi:ABC-type nitrate/sulfonate/bicarbonate transport system substrate-binding protein
MNTDVVRVALVAPAFVYFPVWVAEARGMFADRGLAVQLDVLGSTEAVTAAVASGQSHVGIGAAEGFVARAVAGDSLRLVAGNANRAPLRLVARPSITSVAELRGARIGTSSLAEGTATMSKHILETHGLHYPDDYSFVLAGAHPQRWTSLQAGEIDACLQLIPFDYIAEDAGFSILAAVRDYQPDYVFSVIAVDLAWAEPNALVMRHFVGALIDATAWADHNRLDAAAILSHATGANEVHARRGVNDMIDQSVVPLDLRIDRDGLRAVFATMTQTGFVGGTTRLSYDQCVDTRFLKYE